MRRRLLTFLLASTLNSWSCTGLGDTLPVTAPLPESGSLYDFDLPPQSLADSLAQLSRLTRLNIAYNDDSIAAWQAPPLEGRMTPLQALSRLLATSGFAWQRLDAQTIAIRATTEQGQVIQLQNLEIRSQGWEGYQPEPTVQISHTATPWIEQPQAISRVPNAVLQDQKPRNLDDALRNISGVTQGNTLGSTQDTLMKRGFGDNRDGSILRDGMTSIQGRNFNATTDHIEVLKGPSALLYGIQDPGGMINVVSKTPELRAQNELQSKISTFAQGRDGSTVTLDSTGPLGQSGFAYRLILDHQDETYWRNYGVHREDLVAPSLAWYGEQSEVRLALESREYVTPFDRGTAINPVTGHVLDIPYDRRLDEHFNDMRGRSQLAKLDYEYRLNDAWQLRMSASYNQESYDAYQVRITGVNAATGTLTRSLDGTLDSDSNDRQIYTELSGEHDFLAMKHDLLFGVVDEHRLYFRSDLIRQPSTTAFSYLNPLYGQDAAPTRVSASDSDQSDRLRTQALYARDSIHLNEQWIAIVGGRLLTYDQYAGRGRPFHANTDINGSAFIPSAGLVYHWAPQWSTYVSYSESLKPNSSIAPLNASSVQIIDSAIEPERARAWESGIKYEEQNGLSASIAIYDIRKRNILVSETVNDLPVSRNAGAAHSRGVEFELGGRLSDTWEIIAAYAFTDAQVTKDPNLKGKRLQNVPRQSASLYLSHDLGQWLGDGRLRVGGGPRYVSERPGDPANTFDLPAYTVMDAFVRYDLRVASHPLQLQLNVNNLFDTRYYPSSVNSNMVSVGDPRQLMLSTTLRF
jgi:iron complex outermembrane receptor protein